MTPATTGLLTLLGLVAVSGCMTATTPSDSGHDGFLDGGSTGPLCASSCGVCAQGFAAESGGAISARGIAYALDGRAVGRVVVGGKFATLEGLHPRAWTAAFDATETRTLPRVASGRVVLSVVVVDADGVTCWVGDVEAAPDVDAGSGDAALEPDVGLDDAASDGDGGLDASDVDAASDDDASTDDAADFDAG